MGSFLSGYLRVNSNGSDFSDPLSLVESGLSVIHHGLIKPHPPQFSRPYGINNLDFKVIIDN